MCVSRIRPHLTVPALKPLEIRTLHLSVFKQIVSHEIVRKAQNIRTQPHFCWQVPQVINSQFNSRQVLGSVMFVRSSAHTGPAISVFGEKPQWQKTVIFGIRFESRASRFWSFLLSSQIRKKKRSCGSCHWKIFVETKSKWKWWMLFHILEQPWCWQHHGPYLTRCLHVCALHKFQKDSFGQWHHGMAGMAPRFCTSWTIDIIETVRMTRKLTIDPWQGAQGQCSMANRINRWFTAC